MSLKHVRQPAGYGCLWSAIYAITHNPEHLQHRARTGHAWAAAKLAEEGYVTDTHYNGWFDDRPTPEGWWQAFRPHLQGSVPLLITVRKTGAAKAHEVAIQYPAPDMPDVVEVSDSEQWAVNVLALDEFYQVYGYRTLLVRSINNMTPDEIDPHDVTNGTS